MSQQGSSRLVQFGGGCLIGILLPIFIVIALLFSSLSNMAEAESCQPVDTKPSYAYPVSDTDPILPYSPIGGIDGHFVTFHADKDEEVHAMAAGTVTQVGTYLKIDHTESQGPQAANGKGKLIATYADLTSVSVHVGDKVKINQVVGKATSQMRLQTELDGEAVNPMDFLKDDQSPAGGCGCGSAGGQLVGSDEQQKVFNYFVSKGYTKEQAAGIVGNMMAESGVKPKRLQDTPINVETSAQAAESSPAGWGIVQWTPAGDMIGVSRKAGKSYEEIGTLEWQVDFLYSQLTGDSRMPEVTAGDKLKRAKTAEESAVAFFAFERFKGWDDPNSALYKERSKERVANAQEVFKHYGGGAQGGPGTGCGAGGDFIQTARSLAWPNKGNHGPEQGDAKPEYQKAMPQFNGSTGQQPYSDCGVFVATVIRMSGADPKYPPRGTGMQLSYIKSHPDIWYSFVPTDTSQLQPGDVFVYSNPPDGHTFIYTGNYKGDDGNTYSTVEASWHGHVPDANIVRLQENGEPPYTVARLKNGGSK